MKAKVKRKRSNRKKSNYWKDLLTERKAREAAASKPKPKAKTMAKKNKSEHEEDAGDKPATTDASEQYAGEEFLPPHDPPVVESPPFPPPTGYEVDHRQKGEQPEGTALRELELLQVGTRGEGPAPEPPEEAPPPPEGRKGENGKAKTERNHDQ